MIFRSIIFLALFFIFGEKVSAQRLDIHAIADNYFVFTTYKRLGSINFPSNGMYIVTNDGVVMIDVPWDSTQLKPLLDSIWVKHQKKVVLGIATHFHDDRTTGMLQLTKMGVKTYSSKMTFDLCAQRNEEQPEHYFLNDTLFTVGGVKIETYYPGEGHTKDNIVIWFEDSKILYGGCLVKSIENTSLGNIADANVPAWPATIDRLLKRYPTAKLIIPGHFTWSKDALLHTRKLLN